MFEVITLHTIGVCLIILGAVFIFGTLLVFAASSISEKVKRNKLRNIKTDYSED